MEIARRIYFIFFGLVFTILIDLYLSSSNNVLILLAFIRILGISIAFFYRIIYDNYDKNVNYNTTKTFWNPFKNIFVVIAAIEQAFVMYYIEFSLNFQSILYIIEQVSMPLFAYLWIRRIEKENFSFLQYIWFEIFHSTNDHAEVFVPLYTGRLLSSVAFKEAWLQFQYNLIMFVVVNFAGGFLGGFRMGIFSLCISRLSIRLRTTLFQSYLRQEIGFFDTHESGKLLSRLNQDTQIMSSTVANNIAQCITALVRFIGTLIMMIKLSIHLTIACLVGAPLILIVAKICGNAHRRISEKVQDLSAEAFEIAEETIQTIRTVRSFGNEDEELKRFETTLQQSYQVLWLQAILTAAQKWFVEVSHSAMIYKIISSNVF
ncbi:unnamed protein product [Rotaria sp. Silwood2]|nr:unnamed protein product [Rotaria sp. Silwood2]